MLKLVRIVFLWLVMTTGFAQTVPVTGKVTSTTEPNGLPGVNVVVKGTPRGTITDVNGDFSLEVSTGDIVVFTFVGYKPYELTYQQQTYIAVTLEEEPTSLEEIVVVGYSSAEKRDVTGAVTTVKTEQIRALAVAGIDQALQGQAPGVQITQSSGTPGGGVSVRIRGATSITADNRPLFIIDGIPVEMGALSSRDYGGQSDNALSLINPADIESITILKDASTKATYGSRASNGVVVITTKRGKLGKPKITMDVQRGVITPVQQLDLLNSTQLLELQREAVINAGENPDAFGLIPGVTDAVDTDWQDEVLRTGIMQQYQLSISGGDEVTRFYMSGAYREEEGVQLNNRLTRMSLALNLDRKISDRFSVSTNLTLSRTLNQRVKGDNFLDGVYSGAVKSLPYYAPYDEDGFLVGPGSPMYAAFPNFNPVAQALLPRFDVLSVKLLGGISGSYKVTQNLVLKAQASLDYNNIVEDNYESSQTAIGGFLNSVGGQGYGVYTASIITNVNSFVTLAYSKTLNTDHTFNSLLGTEINQRFINAGSVTGRLFPSDDFTYIQSAGVVDNGTSIKEPPSGLVSFFGDVKYDYKDRILASVSLRTDGSSRFGPNYRFGFFPAASVGWRISQENFFKVSLISDLKIRASYGKTGNERIGDFLFLAQWQSTSYNGSAGVRPSNVDNPNIRWEETSEFNTGFDLALWNGRIQTSVDVYYNKSTDLLLFRPYPTTTGFAGITDNVGDMENKGIELALNTINIDKSIKWSTSINLSVNKNKVLFLPDSVPIFRGYTAEGIDRTNIVKEGEPLGTFWGLNFLGVNPATGNAIYEDANNDATTMKKLHQQNQKFHLLKAQ